MSIIARSARHARISLQAARRTRRQTPPFLIVFVNSKCNLTCEHCFYWRNLNRPDDLSRDEFAALSCALGDFENLNLCGGEPFLRDELAEICSLFVRNNHVKRIYVPTNGYFTSRTEQAVRSVLAGAHLDAFVCELSLDGMPGFHNRLRGNPRSFDNAMTTCDMLTELARENSRLRIHAVSTATRDNLGEIRRLSEFLLQRCPAMEHHNIAILRGDRKDPSLLEPDLDAYKDLHCHVTNLWRAREQGRFGSIVEPLLHWAKCRTIETGSQVVPCTAGRLTGVVFANGDVGLCETHPPIGNLRQRSFFEIWDSPEADALRTRIRAKECHCTNEVFLWPSVVFQPLPLARGMISTRCSP